METQMNDHQYICMNMMGFIFSAKIRFKLELVLFPHFKPELVYFPHFKPELVLFPHFRPKLVFYPHFRPELVLFPHFRPELVFSGRLCRFCRSVGSALKKMQCKLLLIVPQLSSAVLWCSTQFLIGRLIVSRIAICVFLFYDTKPAKRISRNRLR